MRIEPADLASWLPGYYDSLREAQVLMSIENRLFNELKEHLQQYIDNQFILTCDSLTLEAWEQLFNIRPLPSEEMGFRRERMINRLSTRPPFSLNFLIRKLDIIVGPGNYSVRVDGFTIFIESAADNVQWHQEVVHTVHTMKPANMELIIIPVAHDSMSFSDQAFISDLEYLRLGFWRLGQTPFVVRSEYREVDLL